MPVRFMDRYGDRVYVIGEPDPPGPAPVCPPLRPITPPDVPLWTPPPGWVPPTPICDRIICAGRVVDRDGVLSGQPCGTSWHDGCGRCHRHGNPDRVDQDMRIELASARAAGWRIGPADDRGVHNAMCPRCASPDPALKKTCAELASRPDGGQLALDVELPGGERS